LHNVVDLGQVDTAPLNQNLYFEFVKMVKECKKCSQEYEITESDLAFLEQISPIFAGKRLDVPGSSYCPACRHQNRLLFRNERVFYNRKCDLTGKNIVSTYSPDKPFKVYDQDVWWEDDWDGMDYGRDFDFSRTFTEQFKDLYRDVPHMSLYTINCENSYYTNYALGQKNCYLIFGAGDNEDCMMCKYIAYSKDVVDGLAIYSCEFCYEGVASDQCYGCRFFVNSRNCSECTMVKDCSACKNCIACFGLRGKQYCINNKQYSRVDYEKFAKDYEYLDHDKIDFLRGKLDKLEKDLPHIASHVYASENCSGDGIYNSKNTFESFDAKECEDCRYIHNSPRCFMVQDCVYCAPDGVRFGYNVCSTVGLERAMSVFYVWYGSDIYYSIECHNCHNLFGCAGLKSKQYCIFNKQYSKAEYGELVPRIIEYMRKTGEWGEYLAYELSPFAYNETVANEYFPLTKEKCLSSGLTWKDQEESVKSDGDDVYVCEVTGRSFKIIDREKEFYKKMKVPIPKKHPDLRHLDRLKLRGGIKLIDRKCDKCKKTIRTNILNLDFKVYCEECYLEEIY